MHKSRMLIRSRSFRTMAAAFALMATVGTGMAADNPFLGGWELTIPGGAAGWLGVEDVNGQLRASLLWGGGSVLPLDSAKVEKGKLILTRKHRFSARARMARR